MRGRLGVLGAALACLGVTGCADGRVKQALGVPALEQWLEEHAEEPPPASNGSYEDFLFDLGRYESAGGRRIRYDHPGNQYGYIGGWQFGEAALIDAGFYAGDNTPNVNDWRGKWTGLHGIKSKKDFLNSPAAQWHAIHALMPRRWAALVNMGLDRHVGTEMNGVEITASGLLAASHLLGPGGVRDFLRSNGSYDPVDGNNTSASAYMRRFPNYETPYGDVVVVVRQTPRPVDRAPGPVRVVSAKPQRCDVFQPGMTIAEAAQAALDCRYRWRKEEGET